MHRDTTRALELLNDIEPQLAEEVKPKLGELRQILTDMDARTGKRDPSKRPAKKKRAAKKGGR
jgi:hypothetical protein